MPPTPGSCGASPSRSSTVQTDLGSVNPDHRRRDPKPFRGRAGQTAARAASADAVTEVLASGRALNASLTDLARTYAARKEVLHLTPSNARRVVDTALDVDGATDPRRDRRRPDRCSGVRGAPLSPRRQRALDGLDTRLAPGVWRRITFDDHAAADRTDLVHIHLGHPLLQKSARILRNSLFGSTSRVHRVTAVVVDGASASCVAAVSRLVLVGRGGLRLHEEVFLTGIRIRGRELAEEKVESSWTAHWTAPTCSSPLKPCARDSPWHGTLITPSCAIASTTRCAAGRSDSTPGCPNSWTSAAMAASIGRRRSSPPSGSTWSTHCVDSRRKSRNISSCCFPMTSNANASATSGRWRFGC